MIKNVVLASGVQQTYSITKEARLYNRGKTVSSINYARETGQLHYVIVFERHRQLYESKNESESHSVMSGSLPPHGL